MYFEIIKDWQFPARARCTGKHWEILGNVREILICIPLKLYNVKKQTYQSDKIPFITLKRTFLSCYYNNLMGFLNVFVWIFYLYFKDTLWRKEAQRLCPFVPPPPKSQWHSKVHQVQNVPPLFILDPMKGTYIMCFVWLLLNSFLNFMTYAPPPLFHTLHAIAMQPIGPSYKCIIHFLKANPFPHTIRGLK